MLVYPLFLDLPEAPSDEGIVSWVAKVTSFQGLQAEAAGPVSELRVALRVPVLPGGGTDELTVEVAYIDQHGLQGKSLAKVIQPGDFGLTWGDPVEDIQ